MNIKYFQLLKYLLCDNTRSHFKKTGYGQRVCAVGKKQCGVAKRYFDMIKRSSYAVFSGLI